MKIFFQTKVGRNEEKTSILRVFERFTINSCAMTYLISYYDICQRVMNCIFFLEKRLKIQFQNQTKFFFLKPISFVGLLSQKDKNVVYYLELYKDFIYQFSNYFAWFQC